MAYNVAIPPSYGSFRECVGPPYRHHVSDEPVSERNRRLRYAADQMGRELTNAIVRELNNMGHAV